MFFITNNVLAKLVSTDDKPIEHFYVELNFRKKKWLLNCSYNPKHNSMETHLGCLSKSIDSLSSKYDNVVLLGTFNSYMEDSPMKIFCKTYKLRNLIKEATCFKNSENPTCIILPLTNKPLSFKNKYVIETGLFDFHKMVVGVIKMHFPKMKPQTIR